MKSKSYLLFLFVFSAFVIVSCKDKVNKTQKETEINGEVFVVTKGAGNYKLGLVKVTAIPQETIQPFINKKILDRKDLIHSESADSYFNDVNFPQGVTSTTTDADGKFTLKLPKPGRYALAARAERSVITKTEEYNWLVWINASEQNSVNIKLSNDNLTDSGSSDSLIKTY